MIYIAYIFCILSNAYYLFKNRSSKFVAFCTLVIIAIMMGLNTYNADLPDLRYYYNHQFYPADMEYGYVFLSKICSMLSLPYYSFTLLCTVIALIVSCVAIQKITRDFHLYLLYYVSYSMFLDATQNRNTIAVAFMILAVVELAYKRRLFFILWIIIASLFHKTMIILLPAVIFIPFTTKKKRLLMMLFFISLLLAFYIFFNGGGIPGIIGNMISRFVRESKTSYFNARTNYSFVFSVYHIMNIFIAYIFGKYIKENYEDDRIKNFSDVTYIVVLYTTITIPFLMINMNFIRFIRNSNILIVMLMTLAIDKYKKGGKNRISLIGNVVGKIDIMWVIFAVYIIAWIVGYQYDQGVIDVFSNNLIF